jgi:HPt (histidine-containing phosphotransfer) domain-containing protein
VSALDPATIGQLSATLPRDELAAILLTFVDDIGRLARQFAAAPNAEAARRAAHSLAGTAASIGAYRLEGVARQALDRTRTPDPASLAAELSRETEAALTELRRAAETPPAAR